MTTDQPVRSDSARTGLAKRSLLNDMIFLIVSVSIFALILLNRSPNFLRATSLSLRTGLNLSVALYFVVLYLAFRWKGWPGSLLSMTLTLALFAFPLAGLWAVGQSQPTIFNGIVPLFDASSYYGDALRLLAGQDFSSFSARRPLFPGLLAVILWATNHNLMAALGILTLATALACYLAIREIQRTHGVEVAIVVLGILFMFYRFHSGLVMSENLGLPLGAIGFALLWRGTNERNRFLVWLGLLVLTLALNARASTFFMLPLLLVFNGWLFRHPTHKFSWSFFLLGTSAVVLGFVINLVMFRLLANPSGVPFANFSYSLYGLASGGNSWTYVFDVRPDLVQLQEPYQSREIYRMAFDLILHQPGLLIRGVFYNWSMLFSNSLYGAYSYVSGENQTIRLIAQTVLFILCVLGIIRWIRKPADLLNGLVCVAALGIFLSVPFLPPTDAYRMRPYATVMIVFGLLPAMGVLFGLEQLKLARTEDQTAEVSHPNLMVFLIVTYLFFMLIGPVFVKNSGELPKFSQASCDADLQLASIQFDAGHYFNVIRQSAPGLDWMPDFHIGRFRRNSHDMADPSLIQWTESVSPGTTIFYTLDYRSMQNIMVVAPTETLPSSSSLWQVCGELEENPGLKDYNIFYVRTEAVETE